MTSSSYSGEDSENYFDLDIVNKFFIDEVEDDF